MSLVTVSPVTHQMMTNQLATLVTTQSFETGPPFHSQILQTHCLALPYNVPEFLLRTHEGKKHHTLLSHHDGKIALRL
jgi:hypothetical protein